MYFRMYAYVLPKEKLVEEEFGNSSVCGAGREGREGIPWMLCLPTSYVVVKGLVDCRSSADRPTVTTVCSLELGSPALHRISIFLETKGNFSSVPCTQSFPGHGCSVM